MNWPSDVEPSVFTPRKSNLWVVLGVVPMSIAIALPLPDWIKAIGFLLVLAGLASGILVLRERVIVSIDGIAVRRIVRWKYYKPGDRVEVKRMPQVFFERPDDVLVIRSATSSSRITLNMFPEDLAARIVKVIHEPDA